jgi:hypothetical protein
MDVSPDCRVLIPNCFSAVPKFPKFRHQVLAALPKKTIFCGKIAKLLGHHFHHVERIFKSFQRA